MDDSRVSPDAPAVQWLLLVYQLPPKPDYLRVKVRRRLARLGAIPLKGAAYLLPRSEETLEDFQWLRREIVDDGGDASVSSVAVLEGITDHELEAQFSSARDEEYSAVASEARALGAHVTMSDVDRLRRRLVEIAGRDFFGARGREEAERALRAAAEMIRPPGPDQRAGTSRQETTSTRNAVWVTREGVFVDRMASAWLIRRFVDASASFKFVPAKRYDPEPGELRFDMFDGEYTHEGDRCTFETLLVRFGLVDQALQAIAEIVHDIDLKDDKFHRAETAGVAALMQGIALTRSTDEARIEAAAVFLDSFYAQLRNRTV